MVGCLRIVYQLLKKLGSGEDSGKGRGDGNGKTTEEDNADGRGEARGEEGVANRVKNCDQSSRQNNTPASLLLDIIPKAQALRCSQYLIGKLAEETHKSQSGGSEATLTEAAVLEIKRAWCKRVHEVADKPDFIYRPGIAYILASWREWGDANQSTEWWHRNTKTDDGLLRLVVAHAFKNWVQGGTDLGSRVFWHVDPMDLQRYGDVQKMALRIQQLLDEGHADQHASKVAHQFLRACRRLRNGKPTGAFAMFGDDD